MEKEKKMKDHTKGKRTASWAAFLLALLMIVGLVPFLSTVEVRADEEVSNAAGLIDALNVSGKVEAELTSDIVIDAGTINISGGNKTIDGGGHYLVIRGDWGLFTVSGGSLTLKNIKIIVCPGAHVSGRVFYNYSGGSITLSNVEVRAQRLVHQQSAGNITLNDSKFSFPISDIHANTPSGGNTSEGGTNDYGLSDLLAGVFDCATGEFLADPDPELIAITVKAKDGSWPYDGEPHSLNEGELVSGELIDGDSLVVTTSGSIIDVGEEDNVLTSVSIMRGSEDVTSEYDITEEPGTLTVTGREITVTADSASKTYDGTALQKDSATATNLVTGHKLDSVQVTGQRIRVGNGRNVARNAVIVDGEGKDVTENYFITYKSGWLRVGKRSLHITARSAGKVYDGTPLLEDRVRVNGLVSGHRLDSITVTGFQEDVGSSSNVPSAAVIKVGDRDVSSNYDIKYHEGNLRVRKRSATITALNDNKEYDGSPLYRHEATAEGLVEGHVLASADYYGQQTWVGSRRNVVRKARIENAEGLDVTKNYWYSYVDGLLQVTPRPLIIRADSGSRAYDGTPLSAAGARAEGLVDGHELASFDVSGSLTDFGTLPNLVSNAVIREGDKTVNRNYAITYEPGLLEILAKDVVIIVADASKTLNENDPVFTASVEGLVAEGDLGIISYFRSNKDETVGKYTGVLDALFTENPNYRVLVKKGDFEILEPASIVGGEEDIIDGDGGVVKGDEDNKSPVTGELLTYSLLGSLLLLLGAAAAVLGKRSKSRQGS